MINSIIGAKGDMGKNLLSPLLKKIGRVILIDTESTPGEWKNAWEADVIWLSIPRDKIPEILQGVKLKSEQLIIDICSVKQHMHKMIKKTGASHLSLHPMHGPFIPLSGQKWAVIKTEQNTFKNQHVISVLKFLKEQNINFLEASSEDEHDFMIGVVLSIPELLTVVVDSLVREYSKSNKQAPPDIKKMKHWTVPSFNAFLGSYIHSINSSADWLRSELILNAHGNLLEDARKVFGNLSKISAADLNVKLKNQRKFIHDLSDKEREKIRSWVEHWFVDANQSASRSNDIKKLKF